MRSSRYIQFLKLFGEYQVRKKCPVSLCHENLIKMCEKFNVNLHEVYFKNYHVLNLNYIYLLLCVYLHKKICCKNKFVCPSVPKMEHWFFLKIKHAPILKEIFSINYKYFIYILYHFQSVWKWKITRVWKFNMTPMFLKWIPRQI